MFFSLPLSEETLADVFSLQLHLAIDSGLLANYLVSEAAFRAHFLRALFACFVVCSSRASFTRPLGLLLFCEDFSAQHGRGLYVDSYYVPAGLRGLGLGRLLMATLCSEARDRDLNFIRVFFLNRDGLPQLYSKMGFCNETLHDKKIQLLEIYGKENVECFLAKRYFPTKCVLYTEIVCSPVPSTEGKSNVVMVNVFQSFTNKMAGFIEQIHYCGWAGPVLVFKDFVGSTEILDVNLFKSHFKERQLLGAECVAIWFEVAECHDVLIKSLEMSGIKNITKIEGWSIGCLYRSGSNDFSYFNEKYPLKRSIKCGTLTRFETLYKNLYFC